MRSTSILAATAFASMLLAAATAFAGESNYEPFPSSVQFATSTDGNSAPVAGAGQVFAGLSQATLPELGTEGIVESPNALPRNFDAGTTQLADAQSVNRWFAQQADHRFALAHSRLAPRG